MRLAKVAGIADWQFAGGKYRFTLAAHLIGSDAFNTETA
jgi:hypothetical protein